MEQSVPDHIPSRPSNKNACGICGQPKTAWSVKCQRCEANRQRFLAASTKTDDDRTLIEQVNARGQSAVARERGVTRQAIHEMVAKAQRRVAFLAANPLPPVNPVH